MWCGEIEQNVTLNNSFRTFCIEINIISFPNFFLWWSVPLQTLGFYIFVTKKSERRINLKLFHAQYNLAGLVKICWCNLILPELAGGSYSLYVLYVIGFVNCKHNLLCLSTCYLNRQSSPVDGPISKYEHVITSSVGVKTNI